MNEVQAKQVPTSSDNTVRSRLVKFLIELLACFFWTYILSKIFIFDFDVYLVDSFFPSYAWVLKYKFFIFLGLLATLTFFVGTVASLKQLGFIFAYPIIILLWRIPKAILQQKSWILVFAAVSGVVNFFRSFRRNVLVTAIILISFAVISIFDEPSVLRLAAIAVAASVFSIYVRLLLSAFKPPTISKFYVKVLPPIRTHFLTSYKLGPELRTLPKAEFDDAQLKVWASKVEAPILVNRVYLFVAKKFREYQQSPAPFVTGVLTIFSLYLLTIIAFSFVHYSLFKVSAAGFETSGSPTFFSFIWYSFNTLVFNFIKELVPISMEAQLAWMVEALLALFLVSIIVSLYFSIKTQRHAADIDGVINALTTESRELEEYIKEEYQIDSLDAAMAELDRLQVGIIKVIMWFTNNIR